MPNNTEDTTNAAEEFARKIKLNQLIRMEDYREAKDGETIPSHFSCDWWEFTPLLDGREIARTGKAEMLPGLVFYNDSLNSSMACSFSAKSALAIAKSLVDYAGFLLADADPEEVKSLNEGITRALFEGAYSQIEDLVLADHALSARMSRVVGAKLGLIEGARESKELIKGLVKALDLEPGGERDAVLDEIAPQLTEALGADAAS